MPRVLVRDDGERFLLQDNGLYQMEKSAMYRLHQYTLERLVNTGKFKILKEAN